MQEITLAQFIDGFEDGQIVDPVVVNGKLYGRYVARGILVWCNVP